MRLQTTAPAQKRSALLIAYHYPPCGGSSGLQRTLCFSRDLREFGWSPTVLSANPKAYREVRSDQLVQIPPDVPVHRAFALDTARHLGLRRRYIGWMALPDPWVSWLTGAVPLGLRLIRRLRPEVIWSTYPVATAHLIGLALHGLTGVPWIADFRDPMTEVDPTTGQRFPENPGLWSARRWVEEQTIRHCTRAVFVTPTAQQIYRNRYPDRAADMILIGNGYDEDNFVAAERLRSAKRRDSGPLVLVHSGTLYPGPDRDPSAFLNALAKLRDSGAISSTSVHVRLRATGYDDVYRKRIALLHLEDIVTLNPVIPYQAALAEMLDADGLLLFQGSTSNPAVPAKLYEYFRARRPIFALVDEGGDTAAALRRANVGVRAPLDSPEPIAAALVDFLEKVRSGSMATASSQEIQQHSRRSKALELSALFTELGRK